MSFPRQSGASLIAQLVKNLPAMLETWVQFLGREDPLEKGMATHSNILPWGIQCTEDLLKALNLNGMVFEDGVMRMGPSWWD